MKNSHAQKGLVKAITMAGLIAGTLDITAALLNSYISRGTSPVIIFQFIASGILGESSFSGGFASALLGLIMHFFIAFSWTTIFFKVFPKLGVPSQYKVLSGLIYGIIVWLIMNLIIVPLSRTPEIHPGFLQIILGILFLMFCIGLPVSLVYHNFYSKKIVENMS